jgi:hypothetical protein
MTHSGCDAETFGIGSKRHTSADADLVARDALRERRTDEKDPFLNDKEREANKNPDIDLANECSGAAWDMGASS